MDEATITVRKGQVTRKMSREAFWERYLMRFYDPAFNVEREAIERLETTAWDAYLDSRKSPVTRAAGPGFPDPSYPTSMQWLADKADLERAAKVKADLRTPSRVLVICASARNDFARPGEMSKSFRLAALAQAQLAHEGCASDLLDLSLLSSEHDRNIHPCKGCASAAMPLCLDGTHRCRASGQARPLHRLLRTLRDQPQGRWTTTLPYRKKCATSRARSRGASRRNVPAR